MMILIACWFLRLVEVEGTVIIWSEIMENRRKPAPAAATLDINCDCKESCNVELNIRHTRGKVDFDLGTILGGEIGKAPVEHGFGGRDQLDDDAWPSASARR
jgi:hypothetical protein